MGVSLMTLPAASSHFDVLLLSTSRRASVIAMEMSQTTMRDNAKVKKDAFTCLDGTGVVAGVRSGTTSSVHVWPIHNTKYAVNVNAKSMISALRLSIRRRQNQCGSLLQSPLFRLPPSPTSIITFIS